MIRGIQSKALAKKSPVPLGKSLDTLRSKWWIITVNANDPSPVCYVMKLSELKRAAHRGEKDGKVSFWLQPKGYELSKYREKWNRLDEPHAKVSK